MNFVKHGTTKITKDQNYGKQVYSIFRVIRCAHQEIVKNGYKLISKFYFLRCSKKFIKMEQRINVNQVISRQRIFSSNFFIIFDEKSQKIWNFFLYFAVDSFG